jgi:hypothetical protein
VLVKRRFTTKGTRVTKLRKPEPEDLTAKGAKGEIGIGVHNHERHETHEIGALGFS